MDPVRETAAVEEAAGTAVNEYSRKGKQQGGYTMPGLNQTGPAGMGPMTGRGRGMCDTERPVYRAGTGGYGGCDRGKGLGRGFRGRFNSEMRGYSGRGAVGNRGAVMQANPEDDYPVIDTLRAQVESMQHTLDAINKRISEMEKNT